MQPQTSSQQDANEKKNQQQYHLITGAGDDEGAEAVEGDRGGEGICRTDGVPVDRKPTQGSRVRSLHLQARSIPHRESSADPVPDQPGIIV